MTNKAYEYEQWARAWDSLPVEERMPQLGSTVSLWRGASADYMRYTIAAYFVHPERIQIDRITVEE